MRYLLLFFTLFITTHSFAATLSDDFENNNTGGWQNHNGIVNILAPVNSHMLETKHQAYTYKTYSFPVYPNQNITISFDFLAKGKWGNTDTLIVYTYNGAFRLKNNTSVPGTDGNTSLVAYHYDINATTDANGAIGLYIYSNSNNPIKIGYIDNVRVSTNTTDPNFIPFSLRYQASFTGKMLTIGNTVLVAPKKQEAGVCQNYKQKAYISNAPLSNDQYYLCEYWQDKTLSFPTTKAHLNVNPTFQKIRWVGLYWQALDTNTTDLSTMQIKLSHSTSTTNQYISITPDRVDATNKIVAGYTNYAAFANVTQVFQDNNWTVGDVIVGNIPVVEGKIDSIGSYGAWTLVYIYEDPTEPLQNYSVYDGWQKVDKFNEQVDINITGFHTPKDQNASIVAQLSVFAAEGDLNIQGDALSVKPSKQTGFTSLLNNFDSSITPIPPFPSTPNAINNQGIDIHAFDLSTLISHGESSMSLRFTSTRDHRYDPSEFQDTYLPSMVAFSAKLYTPKICYDYTATMGDNIPIASNNRDINSSTFGSLPVKIQFLIQSLEADFTYENAKARMTFTNPPQQTMTYNHQYTEMSPPNDNTYYTYSNHPEIEVNATLGQVALGANVIGNANNNGGTLLANQLSYGILGYDTNDTSDANNSKVSTHFDINFDAQITFNPGESPVDYAFSTSVIDTNSPNYIEKCPTDSTYSPRRLGLNVERVNTSTEVPKSKYTLYTQVTNRPYSVDIVSYTNGKLGSDISTPYDFKSTVEIELINADAFENNSSAGYDTTCQNPRPIGIGTLIAFDTAGEKRHTVRIDPNLANSDWPSYDYARAMHNAAFRLWLLTTTDSNGSKYVVEHQCTDKSNSDNCFSNVYNGTFDTNNTGLCDASCTPNNPNCYKCLKNHYATPICSLDNFSIRPDSFSITLTDDDNWKSSPSSTKLLTKNDNTNLIKVAAGYDYKVDMSATTWNDTPSTGYYNNQFLYKSNIASVPIDTNLSQAILEYDSSTNPGTCYDKNSSSIALIFAEGKLIQNYDHFRFANAGKYNLWLSDGNWTSVDRKDSPSKPTFDGTKVDDCTPGSYTAPNGGKVGCLFYSAPNASHTKLKADVYPYYFSMSGINLTRYANNGKNYAYFTDFTDAYYNTPVTHTLNSASMRFDGLLIAKGAHGQRLSNFHHTCAATDITLNVDYTTDVNTTIPMQLSLQHTSPFTAPISTTTIALGADANITLPTQAFPATPDAPNSINPGEARIYLNTTFQKSYTTPSNPLIATYHAINSYATAASSHNSLKTDKVPDGNSTNYDKNITYYYAKVTPRKSFYPNQITKSQITPLSIDIYCNIIPCPAKYGDLNTSSLNIDELADWRDAGHIFDNVNDGDTNLQANTFSGANNPPSVTPNSTVTFTDTNNTRDDVNVSIAGAARPTTVEVQVQAVPWLLYNTTYPDGYPRYQVEFIDNVGWSGIGKTGSVVELKSSVTSTQRMNW